MHPIMLIEIMIASGVVLFCLIVTLFLKKERRRLGWWITSGLLIVILTFFIGRPYWIEYQMEKREAQLNDFLKEQYPEANWQITRRDFREYGHYSNPYRFQVTYEDEPLVRYTYQVDRTGKVILITYSMPAHYPWEELKYYDSNLMHP